MFLDNQRFKTPFGSKKPTVQDSIARIRAKSSKLPSEEKLVAFALAPESLDAADRAALEADLARDPYLRETVEHIRSERRFYAHTSAG